MNDEVAITRIAPGESGLTVNWGTERMEAIADYVAQGETDEQAIGRKVGLDTLQVRKAIRHPEVQRLIKAAIQARATVAMGRVLEIAIDDANGKDIRARGIAREFVRKTSEGQGGILNQVNNIQTWDPSQDEKLWERGKKFFETEAQRIVEATVERIAGDD